MQSLNTSKSKKKKVIKLRQPQTDMKAVFIYFYFSALINWQGNIQQQYTQQKKNWTGKQVKTNFLNISKLEKNTILKNVTQTREAIQSIRDGQKILYNKEIHTLNLLQNRAWCKK